MLRRTALALPVAALAAATVVPTVASAATITPSKPCYVRVPTQASETMNFALSGGTPGGRWQVYGVNGKAGSVTGSFDGAGNATASLVNSFSTGSISPSAGRTIEIRVREFGPNGSLDTGSTKVKVTNLALDLANRPRGAYSKRVWRVSGLTETLTGSKTVYATWKKGSKTVKRTRLGRANACGYVRVKKSAIPRSGGRSFTLYVHAGSRLDTSKPYLRQTVRVIRRYF
ncbi:hypothetical protein SK069_16200 [Patulibacter brassicae]|uniref:Uncharacterized protein n=1 Tax=Patulibacter brassicae TaxID=1705717 RepID=A0ABU4VQT1_9ACTN|nr:hypothetical protein [Patulibacter brassicae]MDX8153140.1 hypothetical protein [Patulibacter brassicae]